MEANLSDFPEIETPRTLIDNSKLPPDAYGWLQGNYATAIMAF